MGRSYRERHFDLEYWGLLYFEARAGRFVNFRRKKPPEGPFHVEYLCRSNHRLMKTKE
jgi:hypothetical protein